MEHLDIVEKKQNFYYYIYFLAVLTVFDITVKLKLIFNDCALLGNKGNGSLTTEPAAVEAGLQNAQVFFSSLLFDYDQVQ